MDHDHHGMKPLEGIGAFYSRDKGGEHQRDDRFGRLFGDLKPAYAPQHVLKAIGAPGGPMDGKSTNSRTVSVPVGLIFFGQFVDHDMTLDATTTFDSVIDDPGEITNVRTPRLDLDCVYGTGPEAQPFMYAQGGAFGGAKLLTGADNPGQAGLREHDVLRSPNDRAVIGDPRNDENRIISQLQLAMIRFHNIVCDALNAEGSLTGSHLYEEARKQATWHYQWAVVNEFLVSLCGKPVIDELLGCGRSHFDGPVGFIPIEFSVAAYRFGHSMIPMKIQTRKGAPAFELFGSLGRGFQPITDAKAVADWHELLFTPENRKVERALKLDTKLAGDLLALPFITNAENSLPTRNLMRGNAFLLPGGEKVAEAIGCDTKQIDKVRARVAKLSPELSTHGLPLWLYILAEAEVIGRAEADGSSKEGEGLGPVGATIVAETIIGLLETDRHSYLASNRNWAPRPEWDTVGKIATVGQPQTLP